MPVINEIRDAYNNGDYKNQLPYPSRSDEKYKHEVVKSATVLWNEDQEELKKQQYKVDMKAYNEESAKLSAKLHDDMVAAILEEYTVNAAQAGKIYDYAYAERHSSMYEVFGFASEIAELYENIRDLGKSK